MFDDCPAERVGKINFAAALLVELRKPSIIDELYDKRRIIRPLSKPNV